MDQDEEYTNAPKSRATREEVRRRNKEVMEKANQELRESGTAPVASSSAGSKKSYTRLGLIQQHRDGAQSFYCDYQFHNSTPELVFGPLKVDTEVDSGCFTKFDPVSASLMYNECLRNTCLIEPSSVVYLDLINPEETYRVGALNPADEALLSNELAAVGVREEYTGHFLRKPQLMSNDLFAEGGISHGVSARSVMSMNGVVDEISDEFEQVELLDVKFKLGEGIENKVTKSNMKMKRVLSIVPDMDLVNGSYIQFKFDESATTGNNAKLISSELESYERSENNETLIKKHKYIQVNKGSETGRKEDFYLLRFDQDSHKCLIKQVGNKILLKKDLRTTLEPEKVKIIRRD